MSLLNHIGSEFSKLNLPELAICCTMLNNEIKRRRVEVERVEYDNTGAEAEAMAQAEAEAIAEDNARADQECAEAEAAEQDYSGR